MNLIKHLDDVIDLLKNGKLFEAEQLEKAIISYCKNTSSPTVRVVLSIMQEDYDSSNEKIAKYEVLSRHLCLLWETRNV